MKNRNVKTTGIALSFVLPASAFLIIQLSGTWRVTANTSSQPTNEGPVSSRVIAEYPPVELVEKRDDHTRIWQIVREVETTHPDGTVTVDTVKSYIHEKASGLCYRDATGSYVPSVAEWRETPDGFVIDRCPYRLAMGKTIGVTARYTVEDNDLLLRPEHLIISDGVNQADLATLNPETPGFISPDNPSVLRFPSAFGDGYDLEYVAEKGGFHQNLIIANPPQLPDGFNANKTCIHLYTEMNLDQYLSASDCEVTLEGHPVNATAADLVTEPSRNGSISFIKDGRILHAFSVSQVMDSSGPGRLDKQTAAEKRLMKDPASRKAYLVESVPFSYLTDNSLTYPITWDYESKTGAINEDETWEPRYTYRITGNVTVSAALTILPGTTVKLDPSTKITISTDGTVIARGEPYNYITFTRTRDNNCGEIITGPADQAYDRALEILSGSSPSSVVQYCKFGHGGIGIELRETLGEPVAHNIFNDMNIALAMVSCSGAAHNNLITYCSYFGILGYGASSRTFTNNTIDHCNEGIWDTWSTSLTITDNLFSDCTWGISTDNFNAVISHNGFYEVSGGQTGSSPVELTEDPYASSDIGNYFLNDDEGGGADLKNAGSRTALAAGLSDEVFTVRAPGDISPSPYTNQQIWNKIASEVVGSLVAIGYHHSRTDVYLASSLTVTTVSGSLTVEPGVVVGIRGDKHVSATDQGKLVCVGDPSAGGLILLTNSASASMNIESACFADVNTNPYISVTSNASADTRIRFTRTTWLGSGVQIQLKLNEAIRDNVFSLSAWGTHTQGGNILFNNLMHENMNGAYVSGNAEVANCTFDRSQTGLEVLAGTGEIIRIRDSLFTKSNWDANSRAILMDTGAGDIVEYYNGYWQNTQDIYPDRPLGPGSHVVAKPGPYCASIDPDWQVRYKLSQTSSVVNGGSRSSRYGGVHEYSTSIDADRDVKDLDMGYHFATGQYADTDGDGMPDAWEQRWFGGLARDGQGDYDSDHLKDLAEYLLGTYPNAQDSDGDEVWDGNEVEPGPTYDGVYETTLDPAVHNIEDGDYGVEPYVIKRTRTVGGQIKDAMTVMWRTRQGYAYVGALQYREETAAWSPPIQESQARSEHEIDLLFDPQSGLKWDTLYFYKVQRRDGSWTVTNLFRTPIPAGTSAPFSFLVYGDNRTKPEPHTSVVQSMLTNSFHVFDPPRFLLHGGDYTGGNTDGEWLSQFFKPAAGILPALPIWPSAGNHEYPDISKLRTRFPCDWQTSGYCYLSFDYADCRFAIVDTQDEAGLQGPPPQGTPKGAQYEWLEGVLSEGNTKRSQGQLKWIFVVMHVPIETAHDSGQGKSHDGLVAGGHGAKTSFNNLRWLFEEYGVDAVFAGHNHFYERTYSYYEQASPRPERAIHYVLTGGGGAPGSTTDDRHHNPGTGNPNRQYAEPVFEHCVVEVSPAEGTIVITAVRNDASILDIQARQRLGTGTAPTCTRIRDPQPSEILINMQTSGWSYYDSGEPGRDNEGRYWYEEHYNEGDVTGWKSGSTEFWYQDPSSGTELSFGKSAYYFRYTKYLTQDEVDAMSLLALRILQDDGSAVYLNGREVFRYNLVPGASYSTKAKYQVDGYYEGKWIKCVLDRGLLHAGDNVIAVEIHQSPISKDIDVHFDLILWSLSGSWWVAP